MWHGDAGVECVRAGDADAASPGTEAVGVDGAGRVIVVRFPAARGDVVHEHGARLTGLAIGDADPAFAGDEIYAGGFASGETGGVVLQITLRDGRATHRVVHDAGAFVHTLLAIPAAPGGTTQLVAGDYAGRVTLLSPTTAGPWSARVLHVEPTTDDPECLETKQIAAGFPWNARLLFVAVKSGSGLLVDPDNGRVEKIHHEPGGIARAAIDAAGRIWCAGSAGRAFRLDPVEHDARRTWTAHEVFRDTAGLRGVGVGRFANPGSVDTAWFGYSRHCRIVADGADGADPGQGTTIYEDPPGKGGHWLAAADFLPGDGLDEIVLASYTGRIVLLRTAAER